MSVPMIISLDTPLENLTDCQKKTMDTLNGLLRQIEERIRQIMASDNKAEDMDPENGKVVLISKNTRRLKDGAGDKFSKQFLETFSEVSLKFDPTTGRPLRFLETTRTSRICLTMDRSSGTKKQTAHEISKIEEESYLMEENEDRRTLIHAQAGQKVKKYFIDRKNALITVEESE